MKKELVFVCCLLFSIPNWSQTRRSEVRANLDAIHYRDFKDLDEYLSKCQKVAELLPSMEALNLQGTATIQRVRKEHSGDRDLARMADVIEAMNAKDNQGLELLKEEIGLALLMGKLPTQERQKFYETKIVPLHAGEDSIAAQEVAMAVAARKNGIPLPPDVRNAVKNQQDAVHH